MAGRCSARGSSSGCWRTISPPAARRWRTSACTFVQDVSPYELMKIRILNGGHATIAYPAALLDIHFVHEAMQHPLVKAFMERSSRTRSSPPCRRCPTPDLQDYYALIVRRFANPKIGDTMARLAL